MELILSLMKIPIKQTTFYDRTTVHRDNVDGNSITRQSAQR